MKKFILHFITIFLFIQSNITTAQNQFETQGVIVPRTIEFENKTLKLNGFGTRSKMWVDVYVQALYLTNLSDDGQYILESDTEMAVRLQILSNLVSSKKLTKSLNNGMKKSVGEENMKQFESQITQLESLLSTEETRKDDAFNLVYNPIDTSIWVYKNNKFEGKISGFEFKKAFFGIWLSNNPVDLDLKNDLLGK
ncbi:MAG: chalcone isomerase family protein [Flavobacterium sp.]|uniref:chalcone isomerase family protein n=1 Tax=Flavobacterium sp. TaxID=239 RepID=UPI0032670D16